MLVHYITDDVLNIRYFTTRGDFSDTYGCDMPQDIGLFEIGY